MPAHRLDTNSTLPGTGPRLLTVLLVLLVVLAGCGNGSSGSDDDEGHQFATERRPTAAPTATDDAQEEPDQQAPTPEPTAAPETMLKVRGAPQFAYFEIDGVVQVYDTASRTFTPVNLPVGVSVIDFTSSPTGDRVGILGVVDRDVIVQFFGADGEPLSDAIVVPFAGVVPQASPVAMPSATPMTASRTSQYSVNWIPQGNAVIVSGPGSLQRISMSGQVMPISRTGLTGTVVDAIWSPMDSQVAILTQLMNGHQGVFLLDSGSADARELSALHLDEGQSLSNLQWLPNGLGLIFVAGSQTDGVLMNGQLYVYRFDEPVPILIATSGQGGPAGTISHAVVSPDGHSVAYAVMVLDGSTWHLHSLWVRPVEGGTGLSVPLQSSSPITSIVWTAEGLVWTQEDGSISVIDTDMQPRDLGDEPEATPVASPQSTPVLEATPGD